MTFSKLNTQGHGPNNQNSGPAALGHEKMIYLGKMADMDPNECKPGAENAKTILGGTNHGDKGQPLFKDLVDVKSNDGNGDGIIKTNDAMSEKRSSDSVVHDATGKETSYGVDSTFIAKNTKVTFLNPDGSTSTEIVSVRIMQDTGGNTFLMSPPTNASKAEIEMMTTRPIVSVSFSNSAEDYDLGHDGIFTDRTDFPCFARGTMIATETGDVAVEDLRPGMMIVTVDNGLQELRWIGSRGLDARMLTVSPHLRPVRISAGALGNGLPRRDLIVSPQHRVLVRSKIAMKMFGAPEVLVAAKQLLQIEGIDIAADLNEVEYFHFLFERHEVVLSEGAQTESLYTGAEALKSIGAAARDEVLALFPELRDTSEGAVPQGARILASGRMGRKLAVRHAQNSKALLG